MRVEISKNLDDYLDTADKNSAELRKSNAPMLRLIHDLHGYFATTLWRNVDGLSPVVMMLSMNAFMTWLAGVRIALSGHVVAIFPVCRTALESASYAYLIEKDPSLSDVWMNRHQGLQELNACRKEFGGAVKAVAKDIEIKAPGGGNWLLEAYDAAIDFGGHPNIKSILGHVSLRDDLNEKSDYLVSLAGLYGADHWETQRALLACAELALAIALILTNTLKQPDERHQSELQKLNDRKDAIVQEMTEA